MRWCRNVVAAGGLIAAFVGAPAHAVPASSSAPAPDSASPQAHAPGAEAQAPAAVQSFDLQVVPHGRELLRGYLGSEGWETFGQRALFAYALPAWKSEAVRAERAARQSLPGLASELGVRAAAVLPVWIVVSPGGGGFEREAPLWSAAIAQPQRHLIVLSGPAMRRARMSLEETVAHELAHLALAAKLGESGWVPRWFDEGLAMHLSGYDRLVDPLARLGRGPIHLTELIDVFPQNGTRAQLAYVESEAAVRRLLRLGPLQPLLDRLARGEEFDAALTAVYGVTGGSFAEDVYDEVSRRARWLALLGGGATVGGVMTLLFLLGVLRQRWRDRRRMRAWEAAETVLGTAPEAAAAGAGPAAPASAPVDSDAGDARDPR